MKVVNVVYCFLLVLSILCGTSGAISQMASKVNLKTMVSITKAEARFDDLLNSVSKQTAVVFSFSTKKIASDRMIPLKMGRQTLEEMLIQIQSRTGLSYKVVGNHIIFLDKQTAPAKSNTSTTRTASHSKAQHSKGNVTYKPPQKAPSTSATASNAKGPSLQINTSLKDTSGKKTDNTELRDKDSLVGQSETSSSSSYSKNVDSVFRPVHDSINRKSNANNQPASSNRITRRDDNVPSSNVSPRNKDGRSPTRKWFPGAELLVTSNSTNRSEQLKATGVGVGFKMEKPFGTRFSWTAGAHLNYFSGKYTYTTFTGVQGDTSISNFASIPVLLGVKYYPINKLYVSFESGFSIKASAMTRTKLAVVPSAGVLLPLKNNNSLDLGLKYMHVVRGFATPETPGLQAGGYGVLSLRVAYGIKGFR